MVLHTLIVDDKDVVMIPAPNYPLHADIIKLNGGTVAEYCLDV
jgi:aspartate/methionine/tyrosine aminotransferase